MPWPRFKHARPHRLRMSPDVVLGVMRNSSLHPLSGSGGYLAPLRGGLAGGGARAGYVRIITAARGRRAGCLAACSGRQWRGRALFGPMLFPSAPCGRVMAESVIPTVRMPRLGAGAQPPNPFSSSMRLKRAALTTSTLQPADPASDGRTLETCLVTLPPSGGTERYPDPAVTC